MRMIVGKRAVLPPLLALSLFVLAGPVHAQDGVASPQPAPARPQNTADSVQRGAVYTPGAADSLRLEAVRAAAASADPRSIQSDVLERAEGLRMESIRLGRLPQVALVGEGTLQSDVPEVSVAIPGGGPLFAIPKEQFRVEANADWALYTGGARQRQLQAERARLAEQKAGVEAALYPVREAASEAFFGLLLLDARRQTLDLAVQDLETRLRLVKTRAEEGAALEADAALLEAESIRLRQQRDEAASDRASAMIVLADLTGLEIGPQTPLTVPDLSSAYARVQERQNTPRRPELDRLRLQAERIRLEARVISARTRPTLSLFGRGGVGRPSPLDFLSDEVQPYGVAGVRLRWTGLDWGRNRREAEATRLQADLLETEHEALARRFERDLSTEYEAVRRLEAALEADERAVRLREEVLFVAGRQVDEGVILPDVYTDRLTDLAEARLTRERHRIELARARARVLSTLGLFPDATN